jgi:hypothetical protein
VSAVSTMLAWPSRSCTTFRSAPAASANDAAPWRRTCNRTGGNPEAATTLVKRRLTVPGRSAAPPALVNTGPDGYATGLEPMLGEPRTGGRTRLPRQGLVRLAHQTSRCGRRPGGSSTPRAALRSTSPAVAPALSWPSLDTRRPTEPVGRGGSPARSRRLRRSAAGASPHPRRLRRWFAGRTLGRG